MEYDFETDNIAAEIKKIKAKTACIQLPDGLKQHADRIADEIEQKTGCKTIIWMGSNYGACDLAMQAKELGADVLIAYGHSEWRY